MAGYSPELKMTGDAAAQEAILALLDHFCMPDPHYPRGEIHSVYYDTPSLQAYHDKANGDFIKCKVRLRWYEPDISADPTRSTAFFEVKRRHGGGRRKSRVELSLERSWLRTASLDDVGFMRLLDEQRAGFGEELAPDLLPMVVVKYLRFRYVYPAHGVRVALDTCIGSGRVHPVFLPGVLHTDIPVAVFEMKGSERFELPWLHELFGLGFRVRSFSKYGACIARLTGDE